MIAKVKYKRKIIKIETRMNNEGTIMFIYSDTHSWIGTSLNNGIKARLILSDDTMRPKENITPLIRSEVERLITIQKNHIITMSK